MKILITGGAGYVGSVAVPALLAAGHKVRVLDNLSQGGRGLLGPWSHPNFEFVCGDVREEAALRRAVQDVEAVVHLAAIVGDPACARQPELAQAINIEGSLALLRESQKAGVDRFVFASTCSNYGKMRDPDRYVDESSELLPVSLYARTKVEIEETILDPRVANTLCATSLRFATVYGVSPRMRFDLTVNEFVRDLLTKKRLVVYGKQFWRPYIHLHDLARALLTILGSPATSVRGQVYNVGSTAENYTKGQLVKLMQEHAPEAVVEYVHKEEDPRDYRVSFAKINRELGFVTARTVPEGIREVARLILDGVILDGTGSEYQN
jgi:nucleoside-diphosphate-sugar epimerase